MSSAAMIPQMTMPVAPIMQAPAMKPFSRYLLGFLSPNIDGLPSQKTAAPYRAKVWRSYSALRQSTAQQALWRLREAFNHPPKP